MWFMEEPGDWALPPEMEAQTTSVWRFIFGGRSVARLGILRTSFLGEPTVWLEILYFDRAALRYVREALDQMHRLLGEQILWAEIKLNDAAGARFARFAGFQLERALPDRLVMRRTL